MIEFFFVGKNTYVRQGTTEWTYHQPVHSVVYYRYLRFFPREDRVLYRYFSQKGNITHIYLLTLFIFKKACHWILLARLKVLFFILEY